MEQLALDLSAKDGIFVTLFVALLFYVLRTNEKREKMLLKQCEKIEKRCNEREEKYTQTISELMKKLNVVEDIRDDIKIVKHVLRERLPEEEGENERS